MVKIKENVSLKSFSTLFIGGLARYFCEIASKEDLEEVLSWAKNQDIDVYIFGGGSNILFSDNGFNGLVIKIKPKGIEIINDESDKVIIKFMAGEIWDDCVLYSVNNNYWGIENLSHIPGFVGGLPVQNVGAYGQEASKVIENVEVYDRDSQKFFTLSNDQCEFGYRKSIFNQSKQKYIIWSVSLNLIKNGLPNLIYGDLNKYFENNRNPSLKEIRQAVTEIRNKKFPFPDKPTNGNVGSFFRGPIVSAELFDNMVKNIERNLGHEVSEKIIKLSDRLKVSQGYKTPAGLLIEACGLKGKEYNGAIINPAHAAIILNKSGQAQASDVIHLYQLVKEDVYRKTGILLEHEPEFVGFDDKEI